MQGKHGKSAFSVQSPVEQTSSCPIGQYVKLENCRGMDNYACTPCPKRRNAAFIGQGNCNFECISEYFQTEGGCLPCSTDVVCNSDQIRSKCISTRDSVCNHCKLGLKYQVQAQNGTILCLQCTNTPCKISGTYLMIHLSLLHKITFYPVSPYQ